LILLAPVIAAAAGTASATDGPPATRAWSIAASADVDAGDGLNGLACTNSTNCMAVGSYLDDGNSETLTERWNGTTWSVVASPDQTTKGDSLTAVACPGPTSCIAVGTYPNTNGLGSTLVESWNGASWSIIPSPSDGTEGSHLNAISCTSADSCVAVGYYFDESTLSNQTLIESWNGASWSIVSSPDDGSGYNALWGVSCPTSTDCEAVGLDAGGTLIESLTGTTWSIVSSPNALGAQDALVSVTCTNASSCVAAGDYFNGSDIDQTLVESWNGTAWSVVPSPSEQASNNALASVACATPTNCEAVGYYENGAVAQQTLVENWNGSTWSLVLSPNEGTNAANVLSGVAEAGTNWVASGANNASASYQTLVETTFPTPSTTSVASVTSRLVAGQPIAFSVQVIGSGASPPTPTGQITVSDGARKCTATLKGSLGTADARCSIAEQAAGHYSFTASYAGDSVYAASITAAPTSVTVNKATSETTLKLSATKVTLGKEQTEHLSVEVTPQFAGSTPTGTVTIRTASSKLCVITLSSGKGSCSLSSKRLAAGTHHLVATYAGSKNLLSSASAPETLKVTT
jgi:hypothetical protein